MGVYYDHIKHGIVVTINGQHDRRIAQKNIKQLRIFSEEIGIFLDISRTGTDTLHGIISSIGQRDMLLPGKIDLPNVAIFNSRWYFLNERIHKYRFKDARQFHDVVKEFCSLISSYGSYAVHPVFYAWSGPNITLAPNEKSQMSAFQMRWCTLVNEYIRYVKELNKEFRKFEALPIGISTPNPLP